MGSFITKKCIESIAFPTPRPSYDAFHNNLLFLPKDKQGTSFVACMFYKSPTLSNKTLLYSHGNATDIGMVHEFLLKLSKRVGINIISYDYPGYGLTKGKPSEAGCIECIRTVYEYLHDQDHDIFLYGSSLGTGPSIYLASCSVLIRGVLLQAPFSSAVGVVSPCIERSFDSVSGSDSSANPNIFLSYEKATSIYAPVTIIHGLRDEVVPFSHSIQLEKRMKDAGKNCQLISIPTATHNDIERDHFDIIETQLKRIIDQV